MTCSCLSVWVPAALTPSIYLTLSQTEDTVRLYLRSTSLSFRVKNVLLSQLHHLPRRCIYVKLNLPMRIICWVYRCVQLILFV